MKKNRMMRLASTLLILTLLTTSAVSGTFAKYTTSATANDSARVAKWGVTVTATGDDAFAETYAGKADTTVNTVVSNENGKNVLAPGTKGDLGSLSITGTPEVMVNITATAELTLTGWTVAGANDTKVDYCPIVFKVGTEEIKIDGDKIKTVSELESAVETAVVDALVKQGEGTQKTEKGNIAANTDLSDSIAITWEWPFEDTATDAYQTNGKDTELGNKAGKGEAMPTIKFECSATVTQVD